MFEELNQHKHIVVSGPQRSGTTICARMISYSLEHACYLEETFATHHWWGDFQKLFMFLLEHKNGKVVCQCPALSAYVHLLPEDTAVVFMKRPIKDILASEARINWTDAPRMLNRYFKSNGIVSEIKYLVWYQYQKKLIRYAYDIDYKELKKHPLWVEKNQRKDFSSRQINY